MRRTVLVSLATAGLLALSGCSISITANEVPVDPSAEASPNASEIAEISSGFADFCRLEAMGTLDLLSMGGDFAAEMVQDGIQQSIDQQIMVGDDAEACTQAWVDTLAENGFTYDPDAGTLTGELTTPAE